MASIDKLDREALEKFEEDLENRKPSLDPKLYEASAAKFRERGENLEKAELDKLTENIKNEDVKKLNEIKDKILEGDFTPEYTFPYIKRLTMRSMTVTSSISQSLPKISTVCPVQSLSFSLKRSTKMRHTAPMICSSATSAR